LLFIGGILQSLCLGDSSSENFKRKRCPHEVDKSIYGIRAHSFTRDTCVTLVDKDFVDNNDGEEMDLKILSDYCQRSYPSGQLLNVQTTNSFANRILLDLVHGIRFAETAKIFSGVLFSKETVSFKNRIGTFMLSVESHTKRKSVITSMFTFDMMASTKYIDLLPSHRAINRIKENGTKICHLIFIHNTTVFNRFYGRTFPCAEKRWNMFGCVHEPFRDCQLIKEREPYACVRRNDTNGCFLWHRILAKQQRDLSYGQVCPSMSHFGEKCECPTCYDNSSSWSGWSNVDGGCGTKIRFRSPLSNDISSCTDQNRVHCCADVSSVGTKKNCYPAVSEEPIETNCLNGGMAQLDLSGKMICVCPYGFYGRSCERNVNCTILGCVNDGVCDFSTGHCICPTGSTGILCETDVDDCIDNSCGSDTTCVDNGNSTVCACHYPDYADYPWMSFTSFACVKSKQTLCNSTAACGNGGTCVVVGDKELCKCSTGFVGRTCAVEFIDCYINPCRHGYCKNVNGKLTCICNSGYTGAFCEIAFSNCQKSSCQNGGTCRALQRGFVCYCLPGFFGYRCEFTWDPCRPNPCAHGGTCLKEGDEAYCKCPLNFWGKRCETARVRESSEKKPLSTFEIALIVFATMAIVYGFNATVFKRRYVGREVQITDPYQMVTAEQKQEGKMLETYRRTGSFDEGGHPGDTGAVCVSLIAEEEERFQEEADVASENPEDGMYRVTDPIRPEERASFFQPTDREKTCISSGSDPDFTGDTTSLLGKWRQALRCDPPPRWAVKFPFGSVQKARTALPAVLYSLLLAGKSSSPHTRLLRCRLLIRLIKAEMKLIWIMAAALLSAVQTCTAFDLADCNLALGMESREIADEALTASSSFDESSVGPRNASPIATRYQVGRAPHRLKWVLTFYKSFNKVDQAVRRFLPAWALCPFLVRVAKPVKPAHGTQWQIVSDKRRQLGNACHSEQVRIQNWIKTEQNGGAWCPRRQISPTVREWLQIDLGTRRVITAIETQGRYGEGVGQEYATAYSIEYWRPELAGWHRYKDRNENEILPANNDTSTPVLRKMDSPFVATKIRIVPWSDHTRTVCMRVELRGCSFADPLRSYAAPWTFAEDNRRWMDNSYDGDVLSNGTMTGGLGQLYDGVVGSEQFLNSSYDWVGWRRSETGSMVELEFNFASFRNFTSVALHVGYFEAKLMGAFSSASLHFGTSREDAMQRASLQFGPPIEALSRGTRWVIIPTKHRIAMCVLIKLEMATQWLLLSELKFESTPARMLSIGQRRMGNLPVGSLLNPSRKSSVAILSYDFVPTEYVALAIGVILVLIGMGTVFLAVYLVRQKRMNAGKDRRSHMAPIYAYDCLAPVGRADPAFAKGLEALLTANGTVLSMARRPTILPSRPSDKVPSSSARLYDARELSPTDDCYYSEYADPDMASSPTVPLIPPPPAVERRRSVSGSNGLQTSLFGKKRRSCPLDQQHGLAYSLYYASSDVTNPEEEEEAQRAASKPTPLMELFASLGCPFVERSCLEMQEKLGEGEFSEVHLCRMKLKDGISCQVAVKTKRSGGDDHCWKDFERELRVLVKLDHANIVRLLAVSADKDSCLLVFEHMENGDLNQYLRLRGSRLSSSDLLRFAGQIADGMRYLESLHFVHRDLATRNCLLDYQLNIKIADFGMARSLYQSDYYRIEGRFVLPIRWMAWECVLLGKFSTKTDVWAFGVTLWEVYTLASEQPFAVCNDQQVIENLQHMYYNQSLLVYLPKPDMCPPELYALMMSCWSKEETDRPTFADIRSLLRGFTSVVASS
ncbi:hypothetical protein M513_03855, partial [Trichuris suis]